MTSRRQGLRSLRRALNAASIIAMFILAIDVQTAWTHPLHTTLTEITLDPGDGTMHLTIRAFADDFSAVVAKHARKPRPDDFRVSDVDIASYLASAVSVQDARGQPVSLSWSGLRRTGDLMWVTLRAPSVTSLRGLRLVSAILFDTFDDQVNIVQTSFESRHRSMLFTATDGRKFKSIQ